MRLSIIIVNYNTCDLLRQCLQSIPAGCQVVKPEVWVVDNHSTDGSVAMVRDNFPDVKIIANGQNLGFAKANNCALREARGDYFLLLNSDAQLLPGAGDALVAFMDAHPEAGMASPQLKFPDGRVQHTAAGRPTVAGEFFPRYLLRLFRPDTFYARDYGAGQEAVEVAGVVGAALTVRRAAAEKVGYYDENFFFFFEETDWCTRMVDAGWKILVAPQIAVVHNQGGTARREPIATRVEYWRSRYIYFHKHFPRWTLYFLCPLLLVRCVGDLLLNLPLSTWREHSRYKARLAWTLIVWHFKGRPPAMGISQA